MESVSIGTEINLPQNVKARKELRELCRLTAQDGVSLVAIEKCTDTLVGVSFNKIQVNIFKARLICNFYDNFYFLFRSHCFSFHLLIARRSHFF